MHNLMPTFPARFSAGGSFDGYFPIDRSIRKLTLAVSTLLITRLDPQEVYLCCPKASEGKGRKIDFPCAQYPPWQKLSRCGRQAGAQNSLGEVAESGATMRERIAGINLHNFNSISVGRCYTSWGFQ